MRDSSTGSTCQCPDTSVTHCLHVPAHPFASFVYNIDSYGVHVLPARVSVVFRAAAILAGTLNTKFGEWRHCNEWSSSEGDDDKQSPDHSQHCRVGLFDRDSSRGWSQAWDWYVQGVDCPRQNPACGRSLLQVIWTIIDGALL